MSSTRYAADDEELNQQRWASDPDFSTSVSALLAAKRISLITDRCLQDLLWFLQWRSLQPRGLRRLVEELIAKFPERLGTPTMRRLNLRPGKKLSRREIEKLREEFPYEPGGASRDDLCRSHDFLARISTAVEKLHEHLMELCLNPEIKLPPESPNPGWFSYRPTAGVWYFEDLLGELKHFKSECSRSAGTALADTAPSRHINNALDFCLEERAMILIEGHAGIGKSKTVKAWCDMQQGIARYVEVPSSNDDRSFFAAIAKAIGVARGTSYNGQQIKLRVEETLQASRLMLVFDEGQFLWPQYMRPQGIPSRIQWIKTAFDADTPVALVALPTFSTWRELYAEKTNWDDRQLGRRINRTVRLPDAHSNDELMKIARAHFPDGSPRSWKLLVAYGVAERKKGKGAGGVTEALRSAHYRAKRAGRLNPTFEEIEAALQHDHGFLNPRQLESKPAVSPETSPRLPICEGRSSCLDPNNSVSVVDHGRFRDRLLTRVPN